MSPRERCLELALTGQMNATMSKRTIEAREDPMPVWMLTNGSAMMNASTLDTALLHPLESNSPRPGMADITKVFNISQTGIVTWVMDGNPYTEASTPVIYGNSSDGWSANTTLHLPYNSTVDIVMAVSEDSMDKVSHSHHPKPILWPSYGHSSGPVY